MKTISQIAKLSGISVRTLQYYDEIGLLKPSSLSESGYRLYDEEALGKLQQILTLKELDFSLKEVQQLLSGAKSDRAAAFCRKKHQFLIERGHLDRQIELLTRLEERDTIDNLQDLIIELYSGDYIQAVTDTKHGTGSAEYIVSAFQYYLEHFRDEEEKMPENEE